MSTYTSHQLQPLSVKIFVTTLLLLTACNGQNRPPVETAVATAPTDTPPTPGLSTELVAHYPFNGSADDASGNGNDGIVHGAALTGDRFGNADSAYRFDGVDDYIEVPHDPSISLSFQMTISLWLFYERPTSGDFYTLIEKSDPERGGHSRYGLWLINDLVEFCVQPSTQDFHNCLDSTQSLTPGRWHHLAATHDGQMMRLFIDGESAGELTTPRNTISQSAFELFLGADQYSSPVVYTLGVMDDIRIYKRPFSETEITTLYQADR